MSDPLPPLITGERHTPIPVGLLTGRRTPLRRVFAHACAALNRGLDLLPGSRWLHQRIQRSLQVPLLEMPLRRGCDGLDGLTIAFLSDIHAGSFMNGDDLCQIFARVALLQPDLVVFGGDLINSRERELLLFRDALRMLKPRYGMFAVPGNHDHFFGRDIELWTAFLERHGVQVLLNRGVRVMHSTESLWLCGVDDLTEGEPDLSAALAGRRKGETSVLLSHHPDFFFEAAAAFVDLTLSGHTHGGQIRIGGRAPIHHSRFGYEQGWFVEGQSRLYVGRGIGVTVLPIRIDAPPEIPILRLVSHAALAPTAVQAMTSTDIIGAPLLRL